MRSEKVFEESSVIKTVTDIITVTDVITGGINKADNIKTSPGIARSSSLTKATSGLNIVFPCLVTKTSKIDTAMMISRAVERKAVSLLQIAFSAFDITHAKDATDFIKNFHTNLKGKISLDDFIDTMDTYAHENGLIPVERADMFKAVLEDLRSLSIYYPDDVSESSLNRFKVTTESVHGMRIITEADKEDKRDPKDDYKFQYQRQRDYKQDKYQKAEKGRDRAYKIARDKESDKRQDARDEYQAKRDRIEDRRAAEKDARMAARNDVQNQKDISDMFTNQVFSSDIKKANEMVPTMMVVNFITLDGEHKINRQVVIGVKAKLFPVESQDVINKIIVKNADRNILLKFIKASTKEISFLKDFLFAIDNAKLSAIANSRNGSNTNKLLKTLERRALNGKIRKAFKINNAYKAIATLVISREEADYIYKNNNIDVMNPRVIRPIMENLSLMMFIVVDDSAETASILMDSGDDSYETISYTHLEREASDNSSKKIINLMTKLNR